MLKKALAMVALTALYPVNAHAVDTLIQATGVVTAATGAFASLTPPGTPVAGPIRVDVLRGVVVGPANIVSIDLNVGDFCFSTQVPSMCPSGGGDVPITSIDTSAFVVDVGTDTGPLAFTAFSPTFGVNIPVSFDLDANTFSASEATLGTVSGTIDFAVDSDGDGDLDLSDPDDDNDGIGDALDTDPVVANNLCTTRVGDVATVAEMITGPRTCAAKVSVDVEGPTKVMGGDLTVISPLIRVFDGVEVDGEMTAISADPCPGC